MGVGLALYGRFTKGKKSISFGTAITMPIQPRTGYKTVITTLWVTASTTAHTLTVMRPLTVPVTLTALTAAGASYVLNVSADPGSTAQLALGAPSPQATAQLASNVAAANDYVMVALPDGTFYMDTITSVATLAWTMTGTLPTGGAALGANVWWFGITTDTDAWNAEAHPAFTLTASITTKLSDTESGVISGNKPGEPMILYDNNATATGTIELVNGGFVLR